VNRISRDPLLARPGDFFAVRLATLSVPLPSPAEKIGGHNFSAGEGRGTESVANLTAKKSPSLAKRGSRLMRFTVHKANHREKTEKPDKAKKFIKLYSVFGETDQDTFLEREIEFGNRLGNNS